MNSLELITQQRQKEGKFLQIFLVSSLLASLVVHAGAMTLKVGDLWHNPATQTEEDEIELTVTDALAEETIQESPVNEEPPPEPDVSPEVAFVPDMPPPSVPLAPDSQAPLTPGEDAPSQTLAAPTNDPVTPLTNTTGDTPTTGKASGPITSPTGQGSGFGNATRPTGFAPGGKPDGKLDGKPGGTTTGKPGGEPGQTAVRTAPPPQPAKQQPVCMSCPKPKFQGTEASPRVDLKIRPDGSVEVRLRKSSGNPAVDRATLETMSKWRFDPQTVPQEGVRKRVRVTYEEEGSNFQRQNEERRRQESTSRREAEQRRLAEEAQRQTEERNRAPATATTETPAPNSSPVVPAPAVEPPAPVSPPAPEPIVDTPPPAPAAPEPPPVEAPPPAPVEAPPPPPVEVAPSEPSN